MKVTNGTHVEVSGDPTVAGWEGSWWTAVVVRQERRQGQRLVTVRYDELLEDDHVTQSQESVPATRVRPICCDDSSSLPLAQRLPGDPVDCWHEDGWWEGYVHRVYDDHVTFFFPHTSEEYDDIYPPAQPPDTDAHRLRTGKAWDPAAAAWVARARASFPGAGNFRTAPAQARAA